MTDTPIRVLMVCLGNICRSPTAEVVFRATLEKHNLAEHFYIDSAGTGSWHIGNPPDRRSMQAALNRNYDMSALRARQIVPDDMAKFDYVYAMDRQNLADIKELAASEHVDKLSLFLAHGNSEYDEVPDPYYSGADGFELVLDLIEDASAQLVSNLAARHKLI